MPIHFRCPHCEKLLALGTAKGGTQIHCPLCTRLITVPPRTEVKLPTTTVLPADPAKAWWMDAPPAAPPQPQPPADAWWLTANVPSTPAEATVPTPSLPSVPPPLPKPIVAPPSPDLLVFEPPAKTNTLDTNSTSALVRSLTLRQILLFVGVVIFLLLLVSVLFPLLRG